jgi:hypothetical protein
VWAEIMTDSTLLRSTLLFGDLDEDSMQEIVAASKERSLRRGDVLFSEHEEPDASTS